MTTATEIKAKFPHPIQCPPPQYRDSGYCVGGACVLYAGGYEAFPDWWLLAPCLRILNPRLTEFQARNFASYLIGANDSGHIDLAWQYVDSALGVGKPWYRRLLDVFGG